jgi:basic amino acid/polyamine antiporter, APA family
MNWQGLYCIRGQYGPCSLANGGRNDGDAAMNARLAPVPRKLGFWMCMALVMGNMIGSGVFLLPAALAPFGWNAVGGWILTIAGALAIALCLARLTRALPDVDGPHGFTRTAFGDLPALLVTYGYWVSLWVGNAAVATAAISYLSVFVPAFGKIPWAAPAATIALVWLATLISVRGARAAGTIQIITTVIKLVPLIVVLVLIAIVLETSGTTQLAPFPAAGLSLAQVNGAAALTLWAMLGFESASLASASVENPATTIPRATIAGASLTGLTYLIVCSGIALLLPAAIAAKSNAPFADFVARYWGVGPSLFVAGFAAISAMGALNGLTLLQGAVPLSLARAGSFPRWFGVTNAAGTPVRALVGTSLLTTALILVNSARTMGDMFAFMALLSTSTILFLYLAVAAASLKLRVGGAVGAVALLYAVWTLWGAGLEASGWSFALLLTGVPIYGLTRYKA